MARREKRFRQTFPGPNCADNQQMLQDIRSTLGQQAAASSGTAGGSPVERLERSDSKEREKERKREQTRRSSPPSELTSSGSPGTTPRQSSRSTPTKQVERESSSTRKKQLATIRRSLKPFAYSDPGFHPDREKVDRKMLEELISWGYNETTAVNALLACNSVSVELALDHIQQESTRKKQQQQLAAIVEADGPGPSPAFVIGSTNTMKIKHVKESRVSPEKTMPGSATSSAAPSSGQYDLADMGIGRISPISFPGFRTPVSFSELPPPSTPTSKAPRGYTSLYSQQSQTQLADPADVHSDSSPTRTSPPYFQSSPPPYSSTNSKTHVHVSPPPEVHPQSYSPFSAPFSYRRETPPPSYERGYIPSHLTRITPTLAELSDSGIEEEVTPRRPSVPPEAFKFYMEQHIENVFKACQQRQQRRMKLEMEMSKRALNEATSEQMRRILFQKESNFLRIRRAKMHKDMFETVKPLGIGAFGVVSLVRKIDNKKLYAMKTLRKADVLRRNQVAHVKAERDILAEADNEWVVKLFFSFQDIENLYFVMEYIPGGDMMSLLIKLGTFPEHLALFYIAELVCAIESVHKMGFIHRDIKPDNILIGADGHIKLTDFGLCTGFRWTHDSRHYQPKGQHHRQGSMEPQYEQCHCHEELLKPLELKRIKEQHRCVAHSLVGTPNYIAPEILRRNGYTQYCDWWSVGVIMYEMLVGQPPFMAPTPAETQVKIMNWQQYLHIPRHAAMSPAAADLILQLCCDPEERIGKQGVGEVKRHPFFSAIDWEVGIRNYEPPYIPKILYDADTSNFDPIPQSQLQKFQSKRQPELPKGQPQHAFYEWTFVRFYPEKSAGRERPTVTPSSVYSGTMHETRTSASSGSSSATMVSEKKPEKKKATPQPVYV